MAEVESCSRCVGGIVTLTEIVVAAKLITMGGLDTSAAEHNRAVSLRTLDNALRLVRGA